jgi:hypothetical protein
MNNDIPDGEIGHLFFTLQPFSRVQFLDAYARYNAAIWPAQLVALLLGVAIIAMLVTGSRRFVHMASWALALLWLWTGIVCHWLYFASITNMAILFCLAFVFQGLIFGIFGLKAAKLHQAPRYDAPTILGALYVGYALIAYPLISLASGLGLSQMPAFGVTPNMLALFTIGTLLMADRLFPHALWYIPILWTLVGGTTAFLLGMPQDWILLASGPLALLAVWKRLPAEPSAQ